MNALPELKQIVTDVQVSVQHMSDKYDEGLQRLTKQDRELTDIKERITAVEDSVSAKEISDLKDQVNELEQYGRRQNLEIHGVKWEENENLLPKINELAASLGLRSLVEDDIDGIHRLSTRKGRKAPILVRFVSRKTKENWKSKNKQLVDSESEVRFYDNLTSRNKHLLWLARTRAQQMGYCFTWQKNGKVMVRKGPGEPILRISCEADLCNIKETKQAESDDSEA
ncbi:uncharacterized protein LOC144097801 [Amblyomma americanum]